MWRRSLRFSGIDKERGVRGLVWVEMPRVVWCVLKRDILEFIYASGSLFAT